MNKDFLDIDSYGDVTVVANNGLQEVAFSTRALGLYGDTLKLAPIVKYGFVMDFPAEVPVYIVVAAKPFPVKFVNASIRLKYGMGGVAYYLVSADQPGTEINRRSHSRYKVNAGCMVEVDNRKPFAGVLHDVSEMGFAVVVPRRLTAEQSLDVGQFIKMTYCPTEKTNLMLVGKIMRLQAIGITGDVLLGCRLSYKHPGLSGYISSLKKYVHK